MSGIFGGGGGSTTTVVNSTAAPSKDELALIKLNKELATRQLANYDQLAPYQQKLLELSLGDLDQQLQLNKAIGSAITPEQQAELYKSEFERAKKLGPVQDELLNLQLEQLRTGGAATPEQKARIASATDAAITAGTADIDIGTQRGIGLIADELANSRGLRLSDSPIGSEAALLAREGLAQKGSLTKNLRAAQASSELNYPLAVQNLTSGINLNQQNTNNAVSNFQQQVRQQAYQNRLALTGQTSSTGLGLSSVNGVGLGALNALSSNRMANSSQTQTTSGGGGMGLSGVGSLLGGVASVAGLFMSDSRVKTDIVKVGELEPGIGLYKFRYKGGADKHVGVMAQEVEKVIPSAVTKDEDGIRLVDYGKVLQHAA